MTTSARPFSMLHPRDQRIITQARQHLSPQSGLSEALLVMHDTVERVIPGGRVYHLGTSASAPIFGSVISGVGVTEGPEGLWLVRVSLLGDCCWLGRLL